MQYFMTEIKSDLVYWFCKENWICHLGFMSDILLKSHVLTLHQKVFDKIIFEACCFIKTP